MKCRYCGDTLRSINQKLFSSVGEKCAGNPAEIHIGVTDGVSCVYCGDIAKCQAGKLFTKFGSECRNSPTKKHCLQ